MTLYFNDPNTIIEDPWAAINNPNTWGNVPTRLHYQQPQRMYRPDNVDPIQQQNNQNANAGDLLQQIATDTAIDSGINQLQTNLQNKFQGPTTMQGAPQSASAAKTTLQAGKSSPYTAQTSQPYSVTQSHSNYSVTGNSPNISKATVNKASTVNNAASKTRSLKKIPAGKFGILRKYSKGAKVAGRLAPVLGTIATVGAIANQAGETQAMNKDLGGQVAGNVVGASLGGKIGGAIGAGVGAFATTATGGLAAPLVPVLTGLGAAIGGTFGATKGGEVGRNVNIIPDGPSQVDASNPLSSPNTSLMGRESPLYREQLRRSREQASDALFMRGLANQQELEAEKAKMMLGAYMNQQNQYGQMMMNAIR